MQRPKLAAMVEEANGFACEKWVGSSQDNLRVALKMFETELTLLPLSSLDVEDLYSGIVKMTHSDDGSTSEFRCLINERRVRGEFQLTVYVDDPSQPKKSLSITATGICLWGALWLLDTWGTPNAEANSG